MSVGSSSGCLAASAALSAAVDMDAALAQQPNLPLVWALLHDPLWQVGWVGTRAAGMQPWPQSCGSGDGSSPPGGSARLTAVVPPSPRALHPQLPTSELDAAWADAMGETNPMDEPPVSAEDAAGAAELAQAVQRRVKRIAERAFWDSLRERLAGGAEGPEAAAEQLARLLTELGGQLAGVLPDAAAQEVAARLDSARLMRELLPAGSSASLDMPAVFGLLDWCGGLLARYGAPARDAAAAAGQAAVRAQLAAAVGDAAATGAVAVCALRLLTVQLKMLRMDAGAPRARFAFAGACTWTACFHTS